MISQSSIFTVIIVKRGLSDARDISIGEGVTLAGEQGEHPNYQQGCVRCHMLHGFALYAYTIHIYVQCIKHMQLYFTCVIYIVNIYGIPLTQLHMMPDDQ